MRLAYLLACGLLSCGSPDSCGSNGPIDPVGGARVTQASEAPTFYCLLPPDADRVQECFTRFIDVGDRAATARPTAWCRAFRVRAETGEVVGDVCLATREQCQYQPHPDDGPCIEKTADQVIPIALP